MATKSLAYTPPETNGLSKDRAKELVSAGLHRAVVNHGMDAVAAAAECNRRTIENALSMTTLPEAHTLGNILRLEPTCLWEWFAALGFKVVPKEMAISEDMRTAWEMSQALTTYLKSLDDGHIDHNEQQAIAKQLRTLVPKLVAFIESADSHRVGKRK